MRNTELYKNGLLNKLLQVAVHIPEVHCYLNEEIRYCNNNVSEGDSVIDFGCGNGRHLINLSSTLSHGVGVDINEGYLIDARSRKLDNLEFIQGDIENFNSRELYDVAISMYNTIGNLNHPNKAVQSMLAAIKPTGKILISLFSERSIKHRIQMYDTMGLKNIRLIDNKIITNEGFSSMHYTKEEAKALLPLFKIKKFAKIGWLAEYQKLS